GAVRPKPRANTVAVDVTARPTPWAKRLGGPAVGMLGPRRGAMTCDASRPSGLKRGPPSTRSRKPTARSAVSQCHPVSTMTAPAAATTAATTRAARSLTTEGKAKIGLAITMDYAVAHWAVRPL